MSGYNLRDVTASSKTAYCVGSTEGRNISFYLANFTLSNMDVEVRSPNWTLRSRSLTLSDARGSLTDFTVGSGESPDIPIVKIDF